MSSPSSRSRSPGASRSPHERIRFESSSASQQLRGSASQRPSCASTVDDLQNNDSSASQEPDPTLGPLSPQTEDRVFPVRSVVSVDPNSTPTAKYDPTAREEYPGMSAPSSAGPDQHFMPRAFSKSRTASMSSTPDAVSIRSSSLPRRDVKSRPDLSNTTQSRRSSNREASESLPDGLRHMLTPTAEEANDPYNNLAASRDKESTAGSLKSTGDEVGGLITARFQHVVTEEGHAVITGRGGETMQRCEDEPIHIPGAIQGFGLLIALQEEDDGKLIVRIVSENSKRIIGFTPKQLFELENFCDILSEEQADNLLDHIDFIREEDMDPATNGPEVFTLAIRAPSRKNHKLWCAIHLNGVNKDLIICEFELEDDPLYPLTPVGQETPTPPEDTLSSNPSPAELAESTINASRPLRVLRSARKLQEQLSTAPSLEVFLKVLVGVIKELTGFHRVMVYQFDSSWNGRVVTELVDQRATKDLYKGLNFPASDIPKQARDLYKINKVRLLYDRDQQTARLVCRTIEDLETPLDLTYSYLRAMSPIHIKYLANMAVRSSMSVSINAFGELWGLISCHSYGSKGTRVSFPIRKMCRLVGDSASQNIERLSYASRLQARKLINTMPTQSNPSGYIIASSDDLLNLFDADCGLLSIRDETKILGKLEHTQEALAMLEYLRLRKVNSVTSSTDIRFDFPDLRYPPGFSFIAGILLVPLSAGGNDFIVFFRKGQLREVKWAGNPYEKFVKEGTEGYLEPRKSFRTWSETVVGKCKDWREEEIETAAVLCLVYGKFIEVWRQKEAALQNSNLTRLLLANSAHEVRTPLNAIINYLEIAMEGALDQDTRENLSRSYSASKSLIYVINDLLDLTQTEEGNELIKDEIFDFPATVREAAESFTGDAKRKGIDYEVFENAHVPRHVVGDQRRVRQALSNVIANAVQYTTKGSIRVEMWLVNKADNRVEVDVVVQDTGCGMSTSRLDSLFRELEQVQTEDDEGLQEKLAPSTKTLENKEAPKRTLGLGLAVVARIVRNMNGQLRLKSEEGVGSRFTIQLGFDLPVEEEKSRALKDTQDQGIGPPADQPTTPPVEIGEVMLVNKSAQKSTHERPTEMVHRNSVDSVRSTHSTTSVSSVKSDVDRLIEAIQEPAMAPSSGNELDNAHPTMSQNSGSPSRHRRPGASLTIKQAQAPPEAPGTLPVADSKTPIKPIRMPGESSTGAPTSEHPPQSRNKRAASRLLFDLPDQQEQGAKILDASKLQILVAEDDPINSKIIKKRLEKLGHTVHLTINGEECSSSFGEQRAFFDIVLMDMQMPIVDGMTSTKMIRSFEKTQPYSLLSARAAMNGRTPIFTVSASLVEKERQTYMDAGFDGWILKPIDFKRLSDLLDGIVDSQKRHSCLYQAGQWEKGGWFCGKQRDVFAANTAPSPNAPVVSSKTAGSAPVQPEESASDLERERLGGLQDEAVGAKSQPSNAGTSGEVQQCLEAIANDTHMSRILYRRYDEKRISVMNLHPRTGSDLLPLTFSPFCFFIFPLFETHFCKKECRTSMAFSDGRRSPDMAQRIGTVRRENSLSHPDEVATEYGSGVGEGSLMYISKR
ncbi:uncharacterized protein KY384_002711 [Bacidia gigantensis]|uniref:uncharacterized protein n=1 Tax=Bacidia gigantensis TaxID=2732470 RepID=UPI001D04BB37|nr:uncharacterized protein KY384_002711 [Bacidia gigantensis]KAG8532833.1 hypothetical protein KY384_002711 [Bacidia gigantensis]